MCATFGLMPWCSSCNQDKGEAEFGPDRRRASGLRLWCKPCVNERARDGWRRNARSRAANAEAARRRRYGVEHRAFTAMLEGQGGRCAICRGRFLSGKDTVTDYCRATGRFRGILCRRCKRVVGFLDRLGLGKADVFRAYLEAR